MLHTLPNILRYETDIEKPQTTLEPLRNSTSNNIYNSTIIPEFTAKNSTQNDEINQ